MKVNFLSIHSIITQGPPPPPPHCPPTEKVLATPLDLTPGILVDGGEGWGDVIQFLLKMVWIAELVCSSDECVGDWLEDRWVVEGPVVKVSVSVGQFPADLVGRRALVFLGNSNVKEGDRVVLFNLHDELDALVLLVDVLEELAKFLSAVWLCDEGIINVAEPEGGLEMGWLDSFGFEVFHEDVGNDGWETEEIP